MARLTPPRTPSATSSGSGATASKRLPIGLLEPIICFWALWTKRASKATKKFASGSPKASLAKPKQFLSTISNKAVNFRHKNHNKASADDEHGDYDFGDGGLWQRTILMGDKCQPLDFSGVIYYDSDGKRLSELPMKSPRASPLPDYLNSAKKQN